jgi:hypothetical protein
MKRFQIASVMRPGFTGMTVNQRVNVFLLAIRSIVVCAIVAPCLTSARAADALPAKEPADHAAQAQTPAYMPQGYQMERYKAFARQAPMPVIITTGKTTIEVGGTVKTDLSRLAQLSSQEKGALAGQFGVPAGVIGKVAEHAASHPPPDAAQLAQDFRTAVVDYRFLHSEWTRYHPPAEGQQIKAVALQALQGGDISKAWELYDGLQRPAAPDNLRVVAGP